jgi:hypothetical protein
MSQACTNTFKIQIVQYFKNVKKRSTDWWYIVLVMVIVCVCAFIHGDKQLRRHRDTSRKKKYFHSRFFFFNLNNYLTFTIHILYSFLKFCQLFSYLYFNSISVGLRKNQPLLFFVEYLRENGRKKAETCIFTTSLYIIVSMVQSDLVQKAKTREVL